MRVAYIFIFVFLLATASKGQVVEGKVNSYIGSMKAEGIDTFLTYTLYSSGRLPAIDACDSENIQYLFWTFNNQSFMKKFDKCNSYEPVRLPYLNPATFYTSNRAKIEKESIKAPTRLVSTEGGKKTKESQTVSHSFFHKFKLVTHNISTEKEISEYALNFKTFDDGKPNIYYKQNQRTMLKELVDMTTKAIKEFEVVTK